MIEHIQITNLRNLSPCTRLALSKYNIFIGENGSGKTSLLEAVFLLSRGKSFRHHEPKRYITHHQKSCTIWASTTQHTLAVQKNLDERALASTVLKLDKQVVNTQSVLSYKLPTALIDPSGMTALEEGSGSRRQLLDWLVFHVKPEFYHHWLSHQKALKQRNLLLKTMYANQNFVERAKEVEAWDYQLVYHAHQLHQYRQAVFEHWRVFFKEMITRLLPHYAAQIDLSYQAGFDATADFRQLLSDRLQADVELGYTRIGAHRADVMVVFKEHQGEFKLKEQAVNVLSRGEKKLLIVALHLSQLQMICQSDYQYTPVVLIDDIDAELDDAAIKKVFDVLAKLSCQVFVTSLNMRSIEMMRQKIKASDDVIKMFHVKQGVITEIEG